MGKKILLACEAKSSPKINPDHLHGLRELKKEYPEINKRIVVSLEQKSRLTEDNIEILTPDDFIHKLWDGELF